MDNFKKLFLDIKELFENQMSVNNLLLKRIVVLEKRIDELEKILHDKNYKKCWE